MRAVTPRMLTRTVGPMRAVTPRMLTCTYPEKRAVLLLRHAAASSEDNHACMAPARTLVARSLRAVRTSSLKAGSEAILPRLMLVA